jgi:hypothetical protein
VNIAGFASFYSVNLIAICARTAKAFEEWKIETFNAIMDAYQGMRAEYEAALAEARAGRSGEIGGTNPAMNRQIEQLELKKGCIGALHYGPNYWWSHVWFHGPANDWTRPDVAGDCHPPVTNYTCNAIKHGERVKFFEQAFEWNLMAYHFYPYFWGSKCRWRKRYQMNDADPLFLNFLQSGAARVMIPVRPGFEKNVMHFLRTRQVWEGAEAPGIDSPIYLGMVEELKSPVGDVEGEPWEVRVPTALTVLQRESGAVEGDGLPCDCGPEDAFGKSEGAVLSGDTTVEAG